MTRKLPALNAESTAFWQGGAQGKLMIYHCGPCNRFFHPPAPLCPVCLGEDIAPKPVSGKGKVVTYTVNHQPWRPDLKTPYVVAMVELAEQAGLRFVTNIVNCDPSSVYVDMPVKVTFFNQEDIWIPLFEEDA